MFFPKKTETLITSLGKSKVIEILTAELKTDIPVESEEIKKKWFKGFIQNDAFEISLILKRPNNFTPVIEGLVEADEDGKTMVLVKYQLFPSSKRFLLFWTILTLLITVFFIVPYQAYWYGAISFAACFVNYVITKENFNIQVRKSRRALARLLQ